MHNKMHGTVTWNVPTYEDPVTNSPSEPDSSDCDQHFADILAAAKRMAQEHGLINAATQQVVVPHLSR